MAPRTTTGAREGRRGAQDAAICPVAGSGGHSGPDLVFLGTGAPTGRLSLTLPWPPSTNHLYATVNGRRVKTKAARDYAVAVGQRVVIALATGGTIPSPPYAIFVHGYRPDARRRDLSNLIKCFEDALFDAIDQDDCQVTYLLAIGREIDRAHPRLEVTLEHDVIEPRPAASGAGDAGEGG